MRDVGGNFVARMTVHLDETYRGHDRFARGERPKRCLGQCAGMSPEAG
jgi:hypothetical protein